MSVRPAECSAGTTPRDARAVALRIAVGGREPPSSADTASAASWLAGHAVLTRCSSVPTRCRARASR